MQPESKLLTESVNMTFNLSYSMTDQDGIIHQQENNDIHYDLYDAVTMNVNPSYEGATHFNTTAHDINPVPTRDVIQPNPSYSSHLDGDQYYYVEASEIKYHHTVHSAQCTSYLKLISPNVTGDSVTKMTTED